MSRPPSRFCRGSTSWPSASAWPDAIERGLIIAVCIGFFVTLLLARYHGERGAQRVTGTELLILALLLSLGGGLLWRFASAREPAVTSAASAVRANSPALPVAIPDKSIAVLPFDNLSADKDNAYFADGIQDEILTGLARIRELKVISRTSTKSYASRPDNVPQIARAARRRHYPRRQRAEGRQPRPHQCAVDRAPTDDVISGPRAITASSTTFSACRAKSPLRSLPR